MKVALSACLLGIRCRYDGQGNYNGELLEKLKGDQLVAFCPEDYTFGTPRPTMDLTLTDQGIKALSNLTGADLTPPVEAYAEAFFDTHPDVDLFIGKDRSPSCGVRSAKLYDRERHLLSAEATGLMAAKAVEAGIEAWDAEGFLAGVARK